MQRHVSRTTRNVAQQQVPVCVHLAMCILLVHRLVTNVSCTTQYKNLALMGNIFCFIITSHFKLLSLEQYWGIGSTEVGFNLKVGRQIGYIFKDK